MKLSTEDMHIILYVMRLAIIATKQDMLETNDKKKKEEFKEAIAVWNVVIDKIKKVINK